MKPLRSSILAAALLVLGTVASPAADLSGLAVGAKAPEFALQAADGKQVKLADLLKQGPVALVFYRSADW